MIKTKGLDLDIVHGWGLYVRSPESLESLFEELKISGYEIKDCSREERCSAPIKKGWYIWHATLSDDAFEKKGKCDSCGYYINLACIGAHNHECENCGVVTCREFYDGSIINFFFVNKEKPSLGLSRLIIRMKVYGYDDDSGLLLLYPDPLEGDEFEALSIEKAREVLAIQRRDYHFLPAKHSKGMRKHIRRLKSQKKYEQLESLKSEAKNKRFGRRLIALSFDLCFPYRNKIRIVKTWGKIQNYKVVNLLQDKEYSEFLDDLDVDRLITIYEAW